MPAVAPKPFEDRIVFAALYGSVAKHKDTAASDIDLLIVSDDLMLEQLYAMLAPAEDELARKIDPTLYTWDFARRKKAGNAFLRRVLAGEQASTLCGSEGRVTRQELDNLVRVRKLKQEPASPDEVAGLIRSGLTRLKDAGNASLSLESRFDLVGVAAGGRTRPYGHGTARASGRTTQPRRRKAPFSPPHASA